jgi:uncharacterized membrane protein YdjX (TVP38/TMEM64 family)
MNSKKKFYLFIAFLGLSLLISVISGYFGVNISSIENFVTINPGLSSFLFILIFMILASFSFSITVLIGLGAILFSWYELVVYAMIGLMISSIVHFYISRKLGRDYVRNYLSKHGGKIETFDRVVEKDAFKTILILSAIYFVPPAIPNLLGGVIKLDLKKYAIATFIGNLPNTFFTIYLINGLLYYSSFQIYFSIAGLAASTIIAMYFYKGEISDVLKLGFPRFFKQK